MISETPSPTVFLIFDMDGVIVDSNPFHKSSWQAFCQTHDRQLSDAEMQDQVYGKTNKDALAYLFQDLSPEQADQYAAEKEALFREQYRPEIQVAPGLRDFLDAVSGKTAQPVIATSAPPENVDFTLDTLDLRQYFAFVVDETMVSHGKPDPEIYRKAAERLNARPEQCIVFEDSMAGIQAARDAGMSVVGITTTHTLEELSTRVDMVIPDFADLAKDPDVLQDIVQAKAAV